MTRGGARFSRVEPRRRARAFVLGLLAELPRKNCWTIAEHAGDRTPDGMQHLLSRARWDADGSGLRWTIEENFHAGKGLTGLDEHQVRRWTSWYRWVTLAMLGAAVVTFAAAIESARGPDAAGQILLTRNEIAHLLATVTASPEPRRRAPPPLVTLATPPPAPRPDLPLPAANNPRLCNITI